MMIEGKDGARLSSNGRTFERKFGRDMTKAERAGTRDGRVFRTDMYGTRTTTFAMFFQSTVVQHFIDSGMFLSRVNRVLSPTPGRMSLQVDRHLYVSSYNIGSQPPEVSETTRSAETTE